MDPKFIDQLLERYGDRSKLPDDEEQLLAILSLFIRARQQIFEEKQQIEKEIAARQQALSPNGMRDKSKKNTKNK